MKALEDEYVKLKRMLADAMLDNVWRVPPNRTPSAAGFLPRAEQATAYDRHH